MQGLNSRAFFVNLNFNRFLTFFKMTLDFIPRQSRLIFKFNRVTLVVFDIENTIIMTCYAIIVTFDFVGNGSDGWKISGKGMRPGKFRLV